MGLVLQLVETRVGSRAHCIGVLELSRPGDLRDIASLGLTLPKAKQLLACVQRAFVAVQARDHAALRPECAGYGGRCRVKDWRSRQVATLFGQIAVRLLRFLRSGCGRGDAGVRWPPHCRRSTPELDQLHVHLSALITYRVAAGVLAHLLPISDGTSHETLRSKTLKCGERLREAAAVEPTMPAPAITISLDSTDIRSCHEGERHLEVRVGNAEAPKGGRQMFGAVTKGGTDVAALIRRALDTVGRTEGTALTAFTDGCSGLRTVLAAAGVAGPPILDRFHCRAGRDVDPFEPRKWRLAGTHDFARHPACCRVPRENERSPGSIGSDRGRHQAAGMNQTKRDNHLPSAKVIKAIIDLPTWEGPIPYLQ